VNEPTIDEQIAQLKAAGWIPLTPKCWKAPAGIKAAALVGQADTLRERDKRSRELLERAATQGMTTGLVGIIRKHLEAE
jgi:hypothetical protein